MRHRSDDLWTMISEGFAEANVPLGRIKIHCHYNEMLEMMKPILPKGATQACLYSY